jgi:ABC-type nitrate/sulfonate/bicarbonate transport system substrate-binding protein
MTCRRMRGAAVLCALAALAAGCARDTAAVPAAPGLKDLNVAVVPSLDSAGFFIALHEGLFARQGLERAMEALPPPPGLTPDIAALIAPDSYPVGPAGAVRIQRVADVMRQFPGAPRFSVTSMLSGYP